MGIRLDWEIESEQSQVHSAGEDPMMARQRRLVRLRLLLLVLAVLAITGAIIGFIVLRLEAVDGEIADMLRNTVDAEITALRLGDWNAFSAAQRSASGDWLQTQEQLFTDYQQLKTEHDVQLTGRILDVTIDDLRARVKVEEILDGIPYTRVWFYWRYEDGWRHVPPDYTFWGSVQRLDAEGLTVRYQAVDASLAADLAARLQEWRNTACTTLVCGDWPTLAVDILADDGLQVSWSVSNPWLLQIPSPYMRLARSDMPFDLELQFKVATLLVERWVSVASNNMQPAYPADAYYLRQAVVSWLVGQFVRLDTNAFIISSLAQNYGPEAVGRLVQVLQPDSSIQILNQVLGTSSLEQAKLDWRDYLTWRLVTEDDLIRRRDETNFLVFYDTRDETVRNLAYQRFSANPGEIKRVVVSAPLETTADGIPQLRAVVRVGEGETATTEEVLFRLADGVWRRVN